MEHTGQLEVRLFTFLREGRGKKVILDITRGETTILDVLNTLNIKVEDLAVILINGNDADPSHVIVDGEYLALFPPAGGG